MLGHVLLCLRFLIETAPHCLWAMSSGIAGVVGALVLGLLTVSTVVWVWFASLIKLAEPLVWLAAPFLSLFVIIFSLWYISIFCLPSSVAEMLVKLPGFKLLRVAYERRMVLATKRAVGPRTRTAMDKLINALEDVDAEVEEDTGAIDGVSMKNLGPKLRGIVYEVKTRFLGRENTPENIMCAQRLVVEVCKERGMRTKHIAVYSSLLAAAVVTPLATEVAGLAALAPSARRRRRAIEELTKEEGGWM